MSTFNASRYAYPLSHRQFVRRSVLPDLVVMISQPKKRSLSRARVFSLRDLSAAITLQAQSKPVQRLFVRFEPLQALQMASHHLLFFRVSGHEIYSHTLKCLTRNIPNTWASDTPISGNRHKTLHDSIPIWWDFSFHLYQFSYHLHYSRLSLLDLKHTRKGGHEGPVHIMMARHATPCERGNSSWKSGLSEL